MVRGGRGRPTLNGEALSAMVLAAGLGRRMRPLTDDRPKPLVRVCGETLIDHALSILAAGGVRDIVVNVHYLPDMVEAHLARHAQGFYVSVSDERQQLLETGGGIAKALPLLRSDPFAVINTDNIWTNGDGALARLAEAWDGARMDALLLVVEKGRARFHKGPGDFHLDDDGRVTRRIGEQPAPFVYTGLQLLSKRLFEGVAVAPFSLNILWNRAMAAGRVFAIRHDGDWHDVGTPDAVAALEHGCHDG